MGAIGTGVHYNGQAFPGPALDVLPLTPEAQAYLTFIRETIAARLTALDAVRGQNFELYNPDYRDPETGRVVGHYYNVRYFYSDHFGTGNGLHIHDAFPAASQRQGQAFTNVLNAIRDNDEMQLLVNMVNLATAFHPNNITARNGFIEAYTFLYVAKQFPSLVTRQYYRFTLRCGGIY